MGEGPEHLRWGLRTRALLDRLAGEPRPYNPAMSSVKEEARQLVEKLPDDATWDDLMYEVYVRQKIEAGLEAVERGQVVSHEDVKKRFASRA